MIVSNETNTPTFNRRLSSRTLVSIAVHVGTEILN